MFVGAFQQVCQVRLQPIPASVFAIDTIIPPFECQEMVMHIFKVIKHVTKSYILRMVTDLFFIGSHGLSRIMPLTPVKWVGPTRNLAITLNLSVQRDTYIISHFRTNVKKNERFGPFQGGGHSSHYLKVGVSSPYF
jgi:hypothetical protein